MRRTRLDRDIRSVTEFRGNAATLIKRVRETKRAVVLTQRGRGAAVLVDVGEYQRMIEALEPAADTGGTEQRHEPSDAAVDAYKAGIDRTLLRANLARSPAERLRRLGDLAEFAESVRAAPRRDRS